MANLRLGNLELTPPSTVEEFKALIQLISEGHGDLKERTYSYSLETRGENAQSLVSIAQEGKFGTLHLLFQVMNCPDFVKEGSIEQELNADQIQALLKCYTPFLNEVEKHPNIAFLKESLEKSAKVYCTIINKK